MKVSEIIKLLKKNKCELVLHGANHDIWHSPITGCDFTVPRHQSKELPTETADSILKSAGIEKRGNKR